MAVYTRDLIWEKLSPVYGVTPETHTVDDVFELWQATQSLSDGFDLGVFYTTETGISNFGDAEYEYWLNVYGAAGFKLLTEDNHMLITESGDHIIL